MGRHVDYLVNVDQPNWPEMPPFVEMSWLAEKNPLVHKHYETIDAHPRIRAYLAEKYPEGQGKQPFEGHPYKGTDLDHFFPEYPMKPGHWWNLSTTKPAKPGAVAFWKEHGEE